MGQCAADGQVGYQCDYTLADFSRSSNGTALEGAAARLDSNPDIAGIGVFAAVSLAFFFSTVVAFLIHGAEAHEINHKVKNRQHTRGKATKRGHHILDTILKGWSDQQLVLGLATSAAVIAIWCDLSTYHLNLAKQWLIFCSITHANSLLVHSDYFNRDHKWANRLRFSLIVLHVGLAIYVMAYNGQTTDHWTPTVGDRTPLQALPASCFFENATRSDDLERVVQTADGHGISGRVLFYISLGLVSIALISLIVDYFSREWRKAFLPWRIRTALLIGNTTLGCIVFATTLELRNYMSEYNWLKDKEEDEMMSYGQFVPVVLAVLVVVGAAQSYSDDISNKEEKNMKASKEDWNQTDEDGYPLQQR